MHVSRFFILPFVFVTTAAALSAIAVFTIDDYFLPGSQPGQSGQLETPDKCDNCHGGYDAAVEPAFNWRGSMMAQAARDPFFYACMAVANQVAPFSGDLCIRCHSPAGWLEGRSVPTDGSALNNNDRQGVQCDFCHKLVDPKASATYNPYPSPPFNSMYTNATYPRDLTYLATLTHIPPAYANGMYVVDSDNAKRGPFSDAVARHQWYYSPFHSESGICGTCHDVSNPVFTRETTTATEYTLNSLGEPSPSFDPRLMFPVERTFSEWSVSAYNTTNASMKRTCQDCHMRDVTGKGCNKRDAATRTNLPLHDMTGGNTWVPDLIEQFFPGETNPAALAAGKQRAAMMLQSAAELTVSGTLPSIVVRVRNLTGHKLPSGYPEGRRIWLHIRAFDSENALLAEYGGYDYTEAKIYDQLPGSTAKYYYEPALIGGVPVYVIPASPVQPAKSKIYEAKLGMSSNPNSLHEEADGSSFFFVLNNKVVKDNRIPPAGFTNDKFREIQSPPVAHTYADGQDYDETPFTLPSGTARYEVRLLYQTASREYVEFLRDENHTNDWGDRLFTAWETTGKSAPVTMETWMSGAPPDLTRPTAPASLAANAPKFNTVNLSWNPSVDDVAVLGYKVYRQDQGLLATVTTTTYTDGSTSASTTYEYWVTAFDAVGEGSASNHAIVTTPSKGKGGRKEAAGQDMVSASGCRLLANPVRETAEIVFNIPAESRVRITVYDQIGRRLLERDAGVLPAGTHIRDITQNGLAAGVFLVRVAVTPVDPSLQPTEYVTRGVKM